VELDLKHQENEKLIGQLRLDLSQRKEQVGESRSKVDDGGWLAACVPLRSNSVNVDQNQCQIFALIIRTVFFKLFLNCKLYILLLYQLRLFPY